MGRHDVERKCLKRSVVLQSDVGVAADDII
jgi:hypothetical protein